MATKRPPLTIVPNLTRAEAMEAERLAELEALEKLKKVRAAKRRAKRPGNAAWSANKRERHQIKIALAAGLSVEQVAAIVGVTDTTLRKRCPDLIETGAIEVNAKVAQKLFQQIMRGNAIAAMFWCKSRLGWRETHRTEHTGADGGPIRHEQIDAAAAAFTDKIETLAKKLDLANSVANDRAPEPKPRAKEKASCSPSSSC